MEPAPAECNSDVTLANLEDNIPLLRENEPDLSNYMSDAAFAIRTYRDALRRIAAAEPFSGLANAREIAKRALTKVENDVR